MDWRGTAARKRFAIFAWAVLAYNVPVILWGAYVRLSFSGDGCGARWPFCNGQVIPQSMAAPMAIEFTHRAMTSLDTMAAIALCVWAFLSFPRRRWRDGMGVRRAAVLSLVFLFVEALLGAGLVLLRYVAHDQSAGRAVYLAAHLTNTMLLLAALTVTAWLAYAGVEAVRWQAIRASSWAALGAAVVVSITGAVAALGDTLFPATSLAVGMRQDFAAASSLLLRLRMVHPAIAVLGAAVVVWAAMKLAREDAHGLRRAAAWAIGLTLVQLVAGVVNLGLLAPAAMQLVHLFLADALWVAVVVMALEGAAERAGLRETALRETRVSLESHA